MQGVEQLYHLAALFAIWTKDPDLHYKINIDGARAMMLAARDAGVQKIVFTSSVAAIGIVGNGGWATEETPFNGWGWGSEYIMSKFISHQMVKGMVPILLAQAKLGALQNEVSAAVNTYIDDPKAFTIAAAPANPIAFETYSARDVPTRSPRPTRDKNEALWRPHIRSPAHVTTGTPIHKASQVVNPPLNGNGSNPISISP